MTAAVKPETAQNAKAWPFEEARKILKRIDGKTPAKGYVLFETGYGPSGLPHIGTFGEVCRTSMVRRAFELLAPEIPTKLFCFSDDMDGMRKVPDNVPNREMLAEYLHKPLTSVPDPFGAGYESFAHHNNAVLRRFLDGFGFEYEFVSSTQCYKEGRFDAALVRVLETYDQIMAVMLPTLGEERRQSYSPILPISPSTGRVLQVAMKEVNPSKGTVIFEDENGETIEQSVAGGKAKLQWKPDWAMRWHALSVDYEMYGKDLIESAKQSSKICRVLGSTPPDGFHYELFLDENGEKISKSRGNGLTIDEWLRYAPNESLSYYMFVKPITAKRLYFDVIPKAVDEYVTFVQKLREQTPEERIENAAWHIHGGHVPNHLGTMPVSFNLLLNLASVANAETKEVLWGFISNYAPKANPETEPFLDRLTECAVRYYQDFVKPDKRYRAPTETEQAALEDLLGALEKIPAEADAETIQTEIYEIGKRHGFENLRDWFKALYEILLGQSQGPRMGSFIALYGREETKALISGVLDKSLQKTALP